MGTRVERIGSADVEVEVLPELGARLHRLRAFGRDALRTPADQDAYRREPFFWGAYVMAPWCNRLPSGPVRVGDTRLDLPPNFADGTAIHGQVQALPWEVAGAGVFRVEAEGGGWPWRYEVTMSIAVDGPVLQLALQLVNRSEVPMPAGIGLHPWFPRPLEIVLPAERVFTSNADSAPEPVPVAGRSDLRSLREMPPDLDATWAELHDEPVRMRWPGLGIAAALRVPPDGFVCAASPASIEAVAVEPQTHAPNGLRRMLLGEPGGLRPLLPGATMRLDVELAFSRD